MSDDIALLRAESLIELRRYTEAERLLFASLATNPHDPRVLLLLGQAQHEDGRPREALASVSQLLSLVPGDLDGLCRAARIHASLGEDVLARAAAVAAVSAAPNSADAHITLAEVGIRFPSIGIPTLIAAETAVRLAPWASGAYITLGNVQRSLKHPGKARESYLQALRIEPESAPARNNMALLGLDRGRVAGSARTFTGILRENPRNKTATSNVGAAAAAGVRNLVLGLGVLYVALLLADSGALSSSALPGLRIGVAILAPLVAVGYSTFVLREAGAGFRHFVLGALRTDPVFDVMVGLLLLAVSLFALVPVVDFGAGEEGVPFVYFAPLAVNLYIVRAWNRARTKRRAQD